MSYDNHGLFADSAVLIAPVPALTGDTLTLVPGGGALMPAVPFNVTVGPPNARTSRANSEVVRVTQVVGDVVTLVRAQEGSDARAITAGDLFSNSLTPKVFTDIEAAIGTGTEFKTPVAMPALTATPGAAGEYSFDASTGLMAVYVVGTGFLFFRGFQK